MEEAALEHQDQEELYPYCMVVCYLKPLVHDKNVPIFLLHVSDHENYKIACDHSVDVMYLYVNVVDVYRESDVNIKVCVLIKHGTCV